MSTDYFPPIQRAVQGLSSNNQETRAALYEKARAALLRQLNAADPALTESQISRERGLLEEAIRRVEHDYDEAELAPEPVVFERPAAPKPGAIPEPVEEARPDSSEPPAFAQRRSEQRRPQAPRRASSDNNLKRYGIMASVAILIVGGAVGSVLMLRNRSEKSTIPPLVAASPSTPQTTPATPAKLDDRIGSNTPATPGQQVATANPAPAPAPPPAAPAPATPAPLVAPTQSEAPEGQRAHLVEEDPTVANHSRVYEGTVTWRSESQPSGGNGPLDTVVIGELNFPDNKLKATLNLRHNADPALPAAFIVEVRIVAPQDSPNGAIASLNGISATNDPAQDGGDPIDGAMMAVSTGSYLLGAIDPPDEKGREARLLKTTPWFKLLFTFANGRRAIIAFEKGAAGSKIFDEAMASWSVAAK